MLVTLIRFVLFLVSEISFHLFKCCFLVCITFFSPYTILSYFAWLIHWYWKFNIKREEYGDKEKAYFIRKKLGLTSVQWDAMEPAQKDVFFSRQLWIDANFRVGVLFYGETFSLIEFAEFEQAWSLTL